MRSDLCSRQQTFHSGDRRGEEFKQLFLGADGQVEIRVRCSVMPDGLMLMASVTSRRTSRGNDSAKDNDFLKTISVDFSGLESRFHEVFERLKTIERRLDALPQISSELSAAEVAQANLTDVEPVKRTPETLSSVELQSKVEVLEAFVSRGDQMLSQSGEDERRNAVTANQNRNADPVDLVQQIESLRAAQLRMKIDHELRQNTIQMDVEHMHQALALRPTQADMQAFRAEIDVLVTATLKSVQDQQQALASTLTLSLTERERAENAWKANFEQTVSARIQDVWSGMHATARKFQENVQFLQVDLLNHEQRAQEISSFVDDVKRRMLLVEREAAQQQSIMCDQTKDMEHLFAMLNETTSKLAVQEATFETHANTQHARLHAIDRALASQKDLHGRFVADTDRSLEAMSADIGGCFTQLQAHGHTLQALDAGMNNQSGEISRMNELAQKNDVRIGSLDSRQSQSEKKIGTLAMALQEQQQQTQLRVNELENDLDKAAQERTMMRRSTTELQFSLQEVQQTLHDVSKMASATELSLTRAAAEIPKLHAHVSTSASNIAKLRQSVRDLSGLVESEKLVACTLNERFEGHVSTTTSKFQEAGSRSERIEQSVVDAGNTTQQIKHSLEESLRHHGNLIHQLNTMVDSIAITESADGMEDKLARFALSCAELCLKMEHFGVTASDSTSCRETQESVKAELAVLLTKIIRFLGSSVSIDQNKYLLLSRRAQYVDPATGAIITELPPQAVLEGFRVRKATLFSSKTREFMDQLQPLALSNKHTVEYRDQLIRRLQFVLEFGLANLFPNAGRLKNLHSKRHGINSTCIACDRPIDYTIDDELVPSGGENATCQGHPELHTEPSNGSFADQVVAEEHRLRRQQIIASSSVPSPSSASVSSASASVISAATSHRIDTTTAVRHRSGNSGLRPKSGTDAVHHAPGTAEYIYRGGFRLPKPAATPSSVGKPFGIMSVHGEALTSAAAVALAASGENGAELNQLQQSQSQPTMLMDDESASCLERVGLIGRSQNGRVDRPPLLVRPHTAPHRTKSLPGIENVMIDTPTATQ